MKAPTYSPFLPKKKEIETNSGKINVEHNVEKNTGHIKVAQDEVALPNGRGECPSD